MRRFYTKDDFLNKAFAGKSGKKIIQMKSTILRFTQLGYSPEDTEEEKLRKSSLLIMAGPFALAGLIWGLLYFANSLMFSGSILITYGLLSFASISHFEQTKEYQFFRNSQLFLILILPFLLQISLGGFVPGSAVILWAIIAPVGALALDSLKKSLIWFGAFISLVIIAYLINDQLTTYINRELSNGFIDALFLMNIIGISSIVFLIQFHFVGRQRVLKKEVESKNEEFKKQSERLTMKDEMKSNFFANISHEFRTPLTLILGLINKQMTEPEILPSESDNMAMKRNAERLLQLLDLSKLESGETQLTVSKQDIILFSKNMTSQFESFAHKKNIHISLNGKQVNEKSTIPPFEFYFDFDKMQKIMEILLSNAVKFTPKYGAISVDVLPNRKSITIEVGSTDDGIPQEILPHIFDPFFQVDGATNRQYEEIGIGLTLVKKLVELHHGEISVESQNGFTLFRIDLPIDDTSFEKEQIVNDVSELTVESEALIVLPKTSKKKTEETEIGKPGNQVN